MTCDDVDMLVSDAMLALPWLGQLSDMHRTQLVSRLRTALLNAREVGGSKPEVLRRAKGNARTQQTLAPVLAKIGDTQFAYLAEWLYGRLV